MGGLGGGCRKNDPPFFGSKIMNLLVFSILSRKSVSGSRLHGVCMGLSGTSTCGVYALFSHFWYVGKVGDLGDLLLPTLRGVSGDVVTLYASRMRKDVYCRVRGGGGGVSQGIGTQLANAVFHPGHVFCTL